MTSGAPTAPPSDDDDTPGDYAGAHEVEFEAEPADVDLDVEPELLQPPAVFTVSHDAAQIWHAVRVINVDRNGGGCRLADLDELLPLSRRTIDRLLADELEPAGVVRIERDGRGRRTALWAVTN